MPPNRERAKRLILEILRQSEGGLGKTQLFKAFWLAHLYYFKMAPGYLTDWPIVRMPNGPGIDRADRLILDLVQSEHVARSHIPKGPFTEINCRLTGKPFDGELPEKAVDAIKTAVADV